MPMTTLENDVLNTAFSVCKTVTTDLQPKLASLQQLYDAEGGVGSTLTQEEMDEATQLSGLTKQQLDDGLYALTAVILPGIVNAYAALSALAARYRGMLPPPPPMF
jgi:hypothetical protein